MKLCLDFGNSFVKLSIYDGTKEVYYYRKPELPLEKIDDLFETFPIKRAIYSTTRIIDEEILHHLHNKVHLLELNADTKVPINNQYETPKTLGKDRLAAVVAAYKLHPNKGNIVIDAGTCITMDYIDAEGNYKGGNISPGLWMRLKAMNTYTDKLPMVPYKMPKSYLGTNTVKALQNGALRGTIYELQSFITSIQNEFGDTNVIFTGGDTKFFEEHLNFPIFASPNFVLVGLNELLKFND